MKQYSKFINKKVFSLRITVTSTLKSDVEISKFMKDRDKLCINILYIISKNYNMGSESMTRDLLLNLTLTRVRTTLQNII